MFTRLAVLFTVLYCISAAAERPVVPLRQVVIADTEAKALALEVSPSDPTKLHVIDVPMLAGSDFRAVMEPFFGKPISTEVAVGIGNAIARYAKSHDRLITKVLLPQKQNLDYGTMRLVVAVGRFDDIAFRGNRWFSTKLLSEQLGIKPGDEVRLSVLEQAVNWANTNPFRQLKVIVNDIPSEPGHAGLIVGVEEARPWRFSGSVDDYGTDILGNWHYTGTIQFGNLWGKDHQGSYQFVTTNNVHLYQAHVFDYRIPLRWRHFVEISGSYVRVNPTFGASNEFAQTGKNSAVNLKYSVPVRNGTDPIEVHAGLDLKRSNNNLEYAGLHTFASSADTIQLNLGGSIVRRDKHGMWVVAGSVFLSPGGLDSHDNDATYQQARVYSNPRYTYTNLSLQRSVTLPKGWELQSRLIGQIASTNLLGGEQLTIGGPMTVRGFNTNVFAGDEGIIFDNDLLTPVITTKLEKLNKKLPPLSTRFTLFYDFAEVKNKIPIPADPRMTPLASTGVGIRMGVSNSFSLDADYGWQITRLPYVNPEHCRGHIKAVLSF